MSRPGLRIVFSKKHVNELPIPASFRCPVSLEMMKDPVTLPTGITYDRHSIETWLEMGNRTCPVTNQLVPGDEDPVPNHSLRRMIQDWCVANRSLGIERIPTPKIPVTAAHAAVLVSDIEDAGLTGDAARWRRLVIKSKALAKESERNRRCLKTTGIGLVLCSSIDLFASRWADASVTEDGLSALTAFLPLDKEACGRLGSPAALRSIVSMMESAGDLSGRLNAVLALKEIVSRRDDMIESVARTKGLVDSLVKVIKEPISPQTTKASLLTVYYLASSNENTASRFSELGLVPLLLELLVDSDKSMSEKALAVIAELFSCEKGREMAYHHALATPLLVKKILRVSDVATKFTVSALWKLCKNKPECLREALQAGCFQKLLLLLQVGCGEATKEMATDLLKLMNAYKGKLECIESADFRELKRPF